MTLDVQVVHCLLGVLLKLLRTFGEGRAILLQHLIVVYLMHGLIYLYCCFVGNIPLVELRLQEIEKRRKLINNALWESNIKVRGWLSKDSWKPTKCSFVDPSRRYRDNLLTLRVCVLEKTLWAKQTDFDLENLQPLPPMLLHNWRPRKEGTIFFSVISMSIMVSRKIHQQAQERFQVNIRAFISKVASYPVFQQKKKECGKVKNISSAI